MTTLQQEHRAKNEARGMDALREQMRDLSKGREQQTSIAAYKSIRSSLQDRHIEVLYEFKHAGSQGMTARTCAEIIEADLNCISGRVTELRNAGLIEKTGLLHERSKLHRITREGINTLQAR
tara:strand:+ start:87 stop:452 length:366 start_codon:yes stop_codon:yes gene_type:complete